MLAKAKEVRQKKPEKINQFPGAKEKARGGI